LIHFSEIPEKIYFDRCLSGLDALLRYRGDKSRRAIPPKETQEKSLTKENSYTVHLEVLKRIFKDA